MANCSLSFLVEDVNLLNIKCNCDVVLWTCLGAWVNLSCYAVAVDDEVKECLSTQSLNNLNLSVNCSERICLDDLCLVRKVLWTNTILETI